MSPDAGTIVSTRLADVHCLGTHPRWDVLEGTASRGSRLLNVFRLGHAESGATSAYAMCSDLTSHQKGAAFLTTVAATNVLGSQLATIGDRPAVASAMWWLGVALWLCLLYVFLASVQRGTRRPERASR